MNLDEDLQRILNIGAKIYNTQNKKQGKVVNVTDSILIEYTDNSRDSFEESEFKKMLVDDIVVSNSRLTMGSGNEFKIRPRVGIIQPPKPYKTTGKVDTQTTSRPKDPEYFKNIKSFKTGYINSKTGRFREDFKEGYTKIEYREIKTQKVELEVDEDTLAKLKEMGLV
tara:strand:- start:1798 stop:2301 length:504 start_codon:yes stop_codon:yes gene_type:complete